jgi:hypothetical protein
MRFFLAVRSFELFNGSYCAYNMDYIQKGGVI